MQHVPWGSLLSDSTQGDQLWHRDTDPTHVTHSAVLIPLCGCECVCEKCAGDVGFHHVRNTTKVYIPVNSSSGSFVHLCAPLMHNISTTLYIYRTHTSTFFFSLPFWKIIIIQVFAGQFASSDPCLWANWKAALVVLHTFGQLRPCFPQGEQSPASSRCTPPLRFSPLRVCMCTVCGSCRWRRLQNCLALHLFRHGESEEFDKPFAQPASEKLKYESTSFSPWCTFENPFSLVTVVILGYFGETDV